MTQLPYDPDDFNDYLVLKVPLLLALAMVFLSRHLVLPLAAIVASFKRGGSGSMNYLIGSEHGMAFILGSLPAILVLFAWIKRQPESGPRIRWIWHHGRWLLASAALSDIALHLLLVDNLFRGLAMASLVLDVYVIVYLFVLPRCAEVFAQFPQPKAKPAAPEN